MMTRASQKQPNTGVFLLLPAGARRRVLQALRRGRAGVAGPGILDTIGMVLAGSPVFMAKYRLGRFRPCGKLPARKKARPVRFRICGR